jgi:alkaline phosphatase D
MTHFVTNRRTLLQGGILLSLGLLGTARPLLARPALDRDPFTLGVASGDPTADGFVLWTRLAPDPLAPHGGMPIPMAAMPVQWEVAADETFRTVVARGEGLARPELAHSVHVEVAGLQPRRRYWYRFRLGDGATSPVGTVKTAPAAGAPIDRVRFGVAGCQQYEQGFYTAYRSLAEQDELDFIFHYGDYIYEGTGGINAAKIYVRKHLGDTLYSLEDYRLRYAQYKTDPDLQAAHASAAFVTSFDDHEVEDNWGGEFSKKAGVPPEVFLLRRAAAMQAWYEHMPLRAAQFPRLEGMLAYRRFDYGRLLRMHVLDTRSFRSNRYCAKPGGPNCGTMDDPRSTMLGAAQERWLADGLNGRPQWHLLAQQKLVMPLDTRAAGASEPQYSADNWDGYASTRQRLIDAIEQRRLTNVVIASGDAHVNLIGSLPRRPEAADSAAIATEFLAASISSGGDGHMNPRPELAANNPFFALFNAKRGYHLHEVTPQAWRNDVRIVDQIEKPGGAVSTLARFAVDPRRPGPQRA